MKKPKSLSLNSFMNTFRTFMGLIFPLITYPYALRTLGVDNIGKNNYAYSISSYFALLAGLGISRYAIREGARKRDNPVTFRIFAGQMLAINIISVLISYILLFLVLYFVPSLHPYTKLILIHSASFLGTAIGMDWINIAHEEYVYITARTLAFQIISMALLFLMVRSPENLQQYACISVISNIGADILNFFYIRRHTTIKLHFSGAQQHLGQILLLFASSVASVIYVNSDVTMLGALCGDYYTGIYGVSTKIYTIIKQLLSAAIVVALPRLSNLWGKQDIDSFRETVRHIFQTFTTVLFPAMVGLFLMSEEAIRITGGEAYAAASISMKILSISMCFSIFGTFYTNAMLLPMQKEKEITLIMIASAVLNLALNLWFIPRWQQNGAAITTAIAEFFVMFVQIYIVRKNNYVVVEKKFAAGIFTGCAAICIIVLLCKMLLPNLYIRTVTAICISAVVYAGIMVIFKNPFVCTILSKFRKIVGKKT